MALTDTEIRRAKPKDKPYRRSDSGGMYLGDSSGRKALSLAVLLRP